MGKQLNKDTVKTIIPKENTYEELIYSKIYKSMLGLDKFLIKCIITVMVILLLCTIIMLYTVFSLKSVDFIRDIPLFIILFILITVCVVLLHKYLVIVKKYKSIKDMKSINRDDFIGLMNNILESRYPVYSGTTKYYMCVSYKSLVGLRGRVLMDRDYYIVKRYNKHNVVTLVGLYVCGYRIHISDMAHTIKRIEFDELMLLYNQNEELWESKIDEILIG